MSNKWIIGIIVVVVVISGFFLLNKSYSVPQSVIPTPVQNDTQPTVSTPSAITNQQNTITLTPDGFSPATITIKTGTTVVWINKSGIAATVNSNPHPLHTDYSPLNLGKFFDGAEVRLTFDKPGTYGYHNHLNSSQTGSIIVQ